MIQITCWFYWPFLGFHSISLSFLGFNSISLTFFGLLLNSIDLFLGIWLKCLNFNQLMTQAVSWWLASIKLRLKWLSRNFQELTQNQLMTQMDSPSIDSDWLITQSSSPFLIQINSWLRQKVFDSEPTHDSTLSHTYFHEVSTKS